MTDENAVPALILVTGHFLLFKEGACFTISDYSHLQKIFKLCLTGVSGFQFQHDRNALHQITSSAALAASRLAVMVLR